MNHKALYILIFLVVSCEGRGTMNVDQPKERPNAQTGSSDLDLGGGSDSTFPIESEDHTSGSFDELPISGSDEGNNGSSFPGDHVDEHSETKDDFVTDHGSDNHDITTTPNTPHTPSTPTTTREFDLEVLQYEKAGISAEISSKLKLTNSNLELTSSCSFTAGSEQQQASSSVSVKVEVNGNKFTISEDKSSQSIAELKGLKLACVSVFDKSTFEIVDYNGKKYIKYESGKYFEVIP